MESQSADMGSPFDHDRPTPVPSAKVALRGRGNDYLAIVPSSRMPLRAIVPALDLIGVRDASRGIQSVLTKVLGLVGTALAQALRRSEPPSLFPVASRSPVTPSCDAPPHVFGSRRRASPHRRTQPTWRVGPPRSGYEDGRGEGLLRSKKRICIELGGRSAQNGPIPIRARRAGWADAGIHRRFRSPAGHFPVNPNRKFTTLSPDSPGSPDCAARVSGVSSPASPRGRSTEDRVNRDRRRRG